MAAVVVRIALNFVFSQMDLDKELQSINERHEGEHIRVHQLGDGVEKVLQSRFSSFVPPKKRIKSRIDSRYVPYIFQFICQNTIKKFIVYKNLNT